METTRKALPPAFSTQRFPGCCASDGGRTDALDPDGAHFPGMQVGSNAPSADDDRRGLLASLFPSACLPEALFGQSPQDCRTM